MNVLVVSATVRDDFKYNKGNHKTKKKNEENTAVKCDASDLLGKIDGILTYLPSLRRKGYRSLISIRRPLDATADRADLHDFPVPGKPAAEDLSACKKPVQYKNKRPGNKG